MAGVSERGMICENDSLSASEKVHLWIMWKDSLHEWGLPRMDPRNEEAVGGGELKNALAQIGLAVVRDELIVI